MIIPYISKWPQALAIMTLPANVPPALANLLTLVDDICYYAGDRSVDVSYIVTIHNRTTNLTVTSSVHRIFVSVGDTGLHIKLRSLLLVYLAVPYLLRQACSTQ
jgi:rpsU-divergently transcribed protein